MQSLWKKAVFCALILTSCLPVSAMNTTGKQPQEDPQNPVPFAAAVKKDGKWGAIDQYGKVVIEPTYMLSNNKRVEFVGKWHNSADANANYFTDEKE